MDPVIDQRRRGARASWCAVDASSVLARFVVVAVAAALVVACKKDEAAPAPQTQTRPTATTPPPPCRGTAERTGAIHWFADDFDAAVRCAASRELPVVIDLWAPWCHTCISMKGYVFPDPAIAPLADRFVWLAIDTDKEVNEAVVDAYPQQVWPTLVVISPRGEVHGRFAGAAAPEQLREFLVGSEQNFLAGEGIPAGDPRADVVAAERLAIEAARLPRGTADRTRRFGDAAERYRAALAAAPPDWPRRPDVLVAAIDAISRSGDPATCVAFATAHMAQTGRAASATDFLVTARGCADALAEADPAAARAVREQAAARLEGLIADTDAPLSADDRSDAMYNLRHVYRALDRASDADGLAERQRALLDDAAARAPDPFIAMTYNWPRAEVYAYLGRPLELVPALEASAAALPGEYDPPYRLAFLHREAGQLDDAAAWARKAADLAYGPRKSRALTQLADLHRARRDVAAELAARRELIAHLEGLPAGQANPDDLDKARIDLAALEAVTAAP
jgi:thiol-disulfide isomerase/thioredoxin